MSKKKKKFNVKKDFYGNDVAFFVANKKKKKHKYINFENENNNFYSEDREHVNYSSQSQEKRQEFVPFRKKKKKDTYNNGEPQDFNYESRQENYRPFKKKKYRQNYNEQNYNEEQQDFNYEPRQENYGQFKKKKHKQNNDGKQPFFKKNKKPQKQPQPQQKQPQQSQFKKENPQQQKTQNVEKEYLQEYRKLSTIEKLKYSLTKNIFGATPKTFIDGVKISFLGAAKCVTGSKYLLETGKSKILIDCGLFQGAYDLRRRNWNELPISARNVDAIILTHAHLDHSGYIPLLVKDGFKGKIYCTDATFDVAKLILSDTGFLQEEEARYANKKGFSKHIFPKALYTQKDATKSYTSFQTIPFHKDIKIDDEFTFSLTKAGHIIGAGSVLVKTKNGKKILFSGDLGREDSPIVAKIENAPQADYVLIETTYGNRLHEENKIEDYLKDIINKTAAKGGKVIIPAFAVGRSQKVLYYISKLKKEGKIPNLAIFLDSPMSIKVTAMAEHYSQEGKLSKEQYKELYKNVKMCVTKVDSKKIFDYSAPAIIISASGMLAGGRVLHHVANYGPMPNCTILMIGYQAEGTRGRDLQDGKKELKIHGEVIPIRAKIETIGNMSDHADQRELIDWLRTMPKKPTKVYAIHGEIEQSTTFAEKIKEELGWEAEVPEYLESDKL
ncbi:MAG: MBL fold metallo-hydrolase [Rickettsiales bacterium]|jgi:metallo-beta-lactamase family protein|nr:MBL fold metallo-hydrolase [Rickettsiales bacterium]